MSKHSLNAFVISPMGSLLTFSKYTTTDRGFWIGFRLALSYSCSDFLIFSGGVADILVKSSLFIPTIWAQLSFWSCVRLPVVVPGGSVVLAANFLWLYAVHLEFYGARKRYYVFSFQTACISLLFIGCNIWEVEVILYLRQCLCLLIFETS